MGADVGHARESPHGAVSRGPAWAAVYVHVERTAP